MNTKGKNRGTLRKLFFKKYVVKVSVLNPMIAFL